MIASPNQLIKQEILQAILYFDIFNYPITKDEIFDFMAGNSGKNGSFHEALNDLLTENKIFEFDGYYSAKNDVTLIQRRLIGNKKAQNFLKKGKAWSKFIGSFPFVRGVFISGSLSKGFMGDDGDIDYFIITKPGKLWLARTLLVVFKKLFLFNSRKYFCVNYFIDENHLEIEEQNIFTAMELSTVLPTYNQQLYHQLMDKNPWRKQFFPNKIKHNVSQVPTGKIGLFKKILEALLTPFAGILDQFCMNITLHYWQKKFSHFNKSDFKLALKSRTYVSKHHPLNFQKKVLLAYNQKLIQYNINTNSFETKEAEQTSKLKLGLQHEI